MLPRSDQHAPHRSFGNKMTCIKGAYLLRSPEKPECLQEWQARVDFLACSTQARSFATINLRNVDRTLIVNPTQISSC